jgi:hypothetical protein
VGCGEFELIQLEPVPGLAVKRVLPTLYIQWREARCSRALHYRPDRTTFAGHVDGWSPTQRRGQHWVLVDSVVWIGTSVDCP